MIAYDVSADIDGAGRGRIMLALSDGGSACVELVDLPSAKRCGRDGLGISLPTPAGRPRADGGPYCAAHGGLTRADAEARADWNLLAPESVGAAEAVLAAGTMSLRTTEAYVVVRPERTRWLAWLGLGSILIQVPSGVPSPTKIGGGRKRGGKGRRGPMAHDTREAAIGRAVEYWRGRLAEVLDDIRTARGGTLDWGAPIEPLSAPVIVEPGDHGSSWDVALTIPRRGRPGIATISGLRPSGEAP